MYEIKKTPETKVKKNDKQEEILQYLWQIVIARTMQKVSTYQFLNNQKKKEKHTDTSQKKFMKYQETKRYSILSKSIQFNFMDPLKKMG